MAGLYAREFARADHAFLGRTVRFLTDQGITQFLDIGTGIPAAGNTHEVAQRANPAAQVVYVDNDHIVLTHARALVAGHGQGATTVIQADLRDPAAILAHPKVLAALDFHRPVGLVLVAVLHFIHDQEDPDAIAKVLRDALPTGSFLVISHSTDGNSAVHLAVDAASAGPRRSSATPDSGTGAVPLWRPTGPVTDDVIYTTTAFYGGVARKV